MKNNLFQNQKGQSLFEFILFVPFLVFFYTIFYTAGNSINGSINQQKAVRGYFYTLVKGNSYLLSMTDLDNLRDNALSTVGFFAIGWAEKKQGEQRLAPCFEFNSVLKSNTTETCDGPEREIPGSSSRFIRIFTFYGVCGATYLTSRTTPTQYEYNPAVQASGNCILSK